MNIGIGIGIGKGAVNAGEAGLLVSRLYFSAAQAAAVSPSYGAWDDTTVNTRRKLLIAKEAGESLTSPTWDGAGDCLMRQYVGDALIAQTISGTAKCQLRASDDGGEGDLTARLLVKVVSSDGSTVRGIALAIGDYSTGSFLHSSIRNKVFANGDALTPVVVQEGDRLVVEIGVNNPNAMEFSISFGAPSAAADLPENETSTGALVPWIEFSSGLRFQV
jgi:hypothetical protein